MKLIRKLLLSLVAISLSFTAFAQSYQLTGKVSDTNKQAIPGVSISIKGTYRGVTTDIDGNYTIEVNQGEHLIFSFIGYKNKTIQADGNKVMNIIMTSGLALDEIVVVGSRNPNRTAVNTPVPIDIIDIGELTSTSAQVNLNQMLNYVVPSFSSNTQTISDGTDHIDPASLRGLGPDQILVLINGKRRHNSALVNVNGTFGRGNVGTDLNAIPSAAVERIEVLRDGASAQYGSDAIAGVLNIVLKKSYNKLTASLTSGAYFSKNSDGDTDGENTNIALNYGIPLGDKGGHVNFTGEFQTRGYTNRMKEWGGQIFNGYNAIEYISSNQGFDISKLATDLDAIQLYGSQVSHFSPKLKTDIANATTIKDLQTILNIDVTENELNARGLERRDFNMKVGQSKLRGSQFFMNMNLPVGEQAEIYGFGGVGYRNGQAAGFYRLPYQSRTYTPAYINGFLPEIHSDIIDKSVAIGIKGKIGEWNLDFSNTWGRNSFNYAVENSSNASLQNSTPTSFEAGGFAFSQNTTNFDMTRYYENIFSGLNIAFGAEYRLENYEIIAGNENSYSQYNTNGEVHNPNDNSSLVPTDFFGKSRSGGAQVFPGFTPKDELSKNRNSIAGYLDMEINFTKNLLLNFATRYEDYSDFGSTLNFKLASLVKANENLNIRAAASTGFRAPSLHQLYYNSVSTAFVDGIPNEVGTFSNDSRIAKILGIPQLKEETSQSLSLGFTSKIPNTQTRVTVDAYFIKIDNRVILTDQFKPGKDAELKKLFEQANATGATFFANAIDTETKGLDFVVTNTTALGNGTLKSDFAATFSKTKRVGDIHSSEKLKDKEETYFSKASQVYLESAIPRTKLNLTFLYRLNKFNIFLRNVYFGSVKQPTNTPGNQQKFKGKLITDLSLGYDFSDAVNFTVGANNLLDIYPDKNKKENQSNGRFLYSRKSQQFGNNGRFLFARLLLRL